MAFGLLKRLIMSIETIGSRLVELLRNKHFIQAQQELFDREVISREPNHHPAPETRGISNILEKERRFLQTVAKWHELAVSDPVYSRDHFSIRMLSRISLHHGKELTLDEIIVYQVANNKIISEHFFYSQPSRR